MLQKPSITLVNCRVRMANSRTVAAMFKMRSLRAVVIFGIVPPTMSSKKPNVIRRKQRLLGFLQVQLRCRPAEPTSQVGEPYQADRSPCQTEADNPLRLVHNQTVSANPIAGGTRL